MTEATEIRIPKSEFKNDKDIRGKVIQLSLLEPKKYVTKHSAPYDMIFYYHDRKPGANDGGAEETYRQDGGFWKAGKRVKPSATFIKRFNYCPVSR